MKYIEEFRDYLINEKGLSNNTVYNYTIDLQQFGEFIKKPLSKVTAEDVSAFIRYRRTMNDSVSSTNRKLSALKTFFGFLVRKGKLKYNPASSVEGAKKPERLPKPIDEEDIEKILRTVDNLRDKVLISVLYGTGVRREELSNIKVSDINFRSGELRVIGKGNKERIVPLLPELLELIKTYVRSHNSDWLFPSAKTGENLSKRQINTVVKKWANKANLSWVTPHKFRHSFCSHMFNNGAELKTIQDIVGHRSSETTQIYTKISPTRNKQAVLTYHPLAIKEGQPI